MPAAYLIYLTALKRNVLIVKIVELDLDDFDFRKIGQDPVEHFRLVVEGESCMTDLSLFLQFEQRLICPALLIVFNVVRAECVHQIEVKIFYTAGFKLALEERSDLFF